jgi:hypothetical protein
MTERMCIEPACPNRATAHGRCDEHRKQRERERSTARLRNDPEHRARHAFYTSKAWRITRRRQLHDHPLCEHTDSDGTECGLIATVVHHRVDLADGGAPRDPQNLTSLCKSHHDQITRARQLAQG